MNKSAVITLIAVLALIIIIAVYYQFSKPKDELSMQQSPSTIGSVQEQSLRQQVQPEPAEEKKEPTKSKLAFDPSKTYTVTLRTERGDISIALNAGTTPNTVKNFVTLAQKGFYNGTKFHRTIKGFMIQGGDPKGDGTGGPGYQFDDESFKGEYARGTVAMANSGPNTNGSQFFIMHQDYPLPKNYVIFGHVTRGLDVVDAIATAPVAAGAGGEESRPVTPVKVRSVTVAEK